MVKVRPSPQFRSAVRPRILLSTDRVSVTELPAWTLLLPERDAPAASARWGRMASTSRHAVTRERAVRSSLFFMFFMEYLLLRWCAGPR